MKKGTDADQGKADKVEAKNDAKDIQEKMKKVDMKSSSPTSVLAKNAVLLPSGVARVKQVQNAREISQTGSSSGSATVALASRTPSAECLHSSQQSILSRIMPGSHYWVRIGQGRAVWRVYFVPCPVPIVRIGVTRSRNWKEESSWDWDRNPRNKTALAPGHSLMDWIRLGNSGVDLTGVGGVPRVVTLSELASHNKQNDAWIAIRGIVFNVTRYMDFHPGGINELMRGVGKDATMLFESVHAWVNYQSILQKCVVGRLSRGSVSGTTSSPMENAVSSTTNCSSTTFNPITSCTTRNASQENVPDDGIPNLKMDWRQTSNSITLFYQTMRDYPGVCYQLSRISDSKLVFKLFFEKNIITHQLELTAGIEWPPVCTRNFDTMEVDFTLTKKKKEIWKSQGSQTISRETNTNSRTYKEYEVLTNKPLSKLVHLLVVRAKYFLEVIPIGRHLEAKMTVMGMEVSRSYTPVPPCLHPDDMAPNYKSDCLCLMIKKYPIRSSDWKTINLLNFNKDEDNMFYVAQLEKASADKKLKVTHILSQAGSTWTGRRGTVSDDLLKELVAGSSPDACVFTCGPRGFIQSAKK
ncbi:Cytochrome b5 reductase 4 [Eufriesea mexicana]|nr:Cytochrome b5 reductase 4 [Eufriesea mexicana]